MKKPRWGFVLLSSVERQIAFVDDGFTSVVDAACSLRDAGLDRAEAGLELAKRHIQSSEFVRNAALVRAYVDRDKKPDDQAAFHNPAEALLDDSRFSALPSLEGTALLPLTALEQGKAIVPTLLARAAWAFVPRSEGSHEIELEQLSITSGDAAHSALSTQHLRVLVALYARAQYNGLRYSTERGKPYLAIRTSYSALHSLLNCDSKRGGANNRALTRWLDDLATTPMQLNDGENTRSAPIVKHWHRGANQAGDNVVVLLDWRWTEPLFDSQKFKPLLANVFLSISSAMARPLYLHFDWALSHDPNNDAPLKFSTLLERTGALSSGRQTARALRKSPTRQRARVAGIVELEGLPLSNNGTLNIYETNAQDGVRRDVSVPMVVGVVRFSDDANDKSASAPVAMAPKSRSKRSRHLDKPLLAVGAFAQRHASLMHSVRWCRRRERLCGVAAPP